MRNRALLFSAPALLTLMLVACEAPEANKAYAAALEAKIAALQGRPAAPTKLAEEEEALQRRVQALTSTWARDAAAYPLALPEGASVRAGVDAGRKVVTVEGKGKNDEAAIALSAVARHPALKRAAVGRLWVAEGQYAITVVEQPPASAPPAAEAKLPPRPDRSSDTALEAKIDALEAEVTSLTGGAADQLAAVEALRAQVAAEEAALKQRPTPDGRFFAWLHLALLEEEPAIERVVVTCTNAGGCELELEAEGPSAPGLPQGALQPWLDELREVEPGDKHIKLKAKVKTPSRLEPLAR